MSGGEGEPVQERLSVFVRELSVEAAIGLYPHEHAGPQPLLVDIELELTPAPVRRIGQTVDYDSLVAKAREMASGHIDLVETFAQRLAAACLDDPRAVRCRVRVEKPRAVQGAAAAGVEAVVSRS